MELRHLRYFIAVAEELNFSRAAERLHVSQPPLSQQIKQLEEEVKVQLLDRSTRWVRMTIAGRLFLEHARQILAQVESAVLAAREGRADSYSNVSDHSQSAPHLLRQTGHARTNGDQPYGPSRLLREPQRPRHDGGKAIGTTRARGARVPEAS